MGKGRYRIEKSDEQLIFRDNLSYYIKQSGMSQAEISRRCGIHRGFFHRGFNSAGFKTIQISHVSKLADCLGVPINALFSSEKAEVTAKKEFNKELKSNPELITKFFRALKRQLHYE